MSEIWMACDDCTRSTSGRCWRHQPLPFKSTGALLTEAAARVRELEGQVVVLREMLRNAEVDLFALGGDNASREFRRAISAAGPTTEAFVERVRHEARYEGRVEGVRAALSFAWRGDATLPEVPPATTEEIAAAAEQIVAALESKP